MKNFLGVVVLLVLSPVLVCSLNCWMCPGGESSFKLCDDNKVNQSCTPDLTRCGTFSFVNKTGVRIFAKSCTYESYCSKNSTFCANVQGGGATFCRVQCCETELCNFQVGFATTTAPSTTAATTTRQKTTTTATTPRPPPTTKPMTSAPPETTEEPTTKPMTSAPPEPTKQPTEAPLNPSKDPQSGDDEEDCSWVDGAGSSLTSNVVNSGTCFVLLVIIRLLIL